MNNSPRIITETVSSRRSLAVVKLKPPVGMIPALQVKFALSLMLTGYTVMVLVNSDGESDKSGDTDTRLVELDNTVVPFSHVIDMFTFFVKLGSMLALHVSLNEVLAPAYRSSGMVDMCTEGVGTAWKKIISLQDGFSH